MRVLFLGTYSSNSGPDNVNRALLTVADNRMDYVRDKNKVSKLIEIIGKLKKCDIVVISGICSLKVLRLIKYYRKPFVYLMHGDLDYESIINHEKISQNVHDAQLYILNNAKRIICVSEKFAEWVKERYPQYNDRITFVNNGIEVSTRKKKKKIPFSIAVGGGNRSIKANEYVCEAVRMLQEQGIKCKLFVFGREYESCPQLPLISGMQFMDHLDKSEYYDYLDNIGIFIINSEVESFSLSVADAINCNCSLLMSQNVGALSIFSLQKEDIIQNNHDPNEIANKIKWIEKNSNTDRLYKSLNIEEISVEKSYIRIMDICRDII